MKFNWDSVIVGILTGAITPFIGYGLVSYIFDLLTTAGVMDEVTMSTAGGRQKTLWLLAICCNLIPFNIFKAKKMDNALRGTVFPTLIAVGLWLYTYRSILFGSF